MQGQGQPSSTNLTMHAFNVCTFTIIASNYTCGFSIRTRMPRSLAASKVAYNDDQHVCRQNPCNGVVLTASSKAQCVSSDTADLETVLEWSR